MPQDFSVFNQNQFGSTLDPIHFEGKVIVVGAGAAGLFAGYALKELGIDFKVLEASDSIGGRLGKVEGFADFPIDQGAQWLHGKKSIIGRLIKETGTKISKDKSDEFYWFKNQLLKKLPQKVWKVVEPDGDLPDISFGEYAVQEGLGEAYRYVVEQLAGDYGADSSELSIKWTAVEEEDWSSGGSDFKFEETYFDLIDGHIASKIRDSIQLHTIVRKIDYSQEQIAVTDQEGNIHLADKVILTVPLPVLQDVDIHFTPPLTAKKKEALSKIGMGAGMKVFLKFTSRFYKENVAGGKICAAYADEITGKKGRDHVLMAFVMGKQAEYLTALGSDTAIAQALLEELDEMYAGQASEAFMDVHVENYTTKPFIRGAYSFSKVGIGDARSIAAEALADKIFFAGEAMNLNGHHQTVHGAAETGIAAVLNILELNDPIS